MDTKKKICDKNQKNAIPKIGIVGLGLMGGSLGRSLIKRTQCRVFGFDIKEGAIDAAKHVDAIHDELTDSVLMDIDVLVFAVTPRVTLEVLPKYIPRLKEGCIVTDLCGTKRGVVEAMQALSEKFPKLVFIGGHPMAGKEYSGLSHSTAELYMGASFLFVNVNADEAQLEMLEELYRCVGFRTLKRVEAETHDTMIAFTSQLCHVISSAYCLNPLSKDHDGFSAGSFHDLTRVARLDATMWSELLCDNSDNLSKVIDEFTAEVSQLNAAIKNKDQKKVFDILTNANAKKEQIDKFSEAFNRFLAKEES